MAILLVVETGAGVINANSYVSVDDFKTYAEGRGITLPTSDDAIASLLIEAYDFVTTYECKFSGSRTFPLEQTGAWPRTDAFMNGAELPNNVIPGPVKTAQMQIAIAANTGIVLFPSQTGAAVKREKIGPIDTEYENNTWSASNLPVLSNVELTIRPLETAGTCGQCGPIWKTIRV